MTDGARDPGLSSGPDSSYDEADPPDPQPETTPGLAPGGSVLVALLLLVRTL